MEIWHVGVIALCTGLLLRRIRLVGRSEEDAPFEGITDLYPVPLHAVHRRAWPPETPPARGAGAAGEPGSDPHPGRTQAIREILDQARQEINGAQIHARSLLINAQAQAQATLDRAREEYAAMFAELSKNSGFRPGDPTSWSRRGRDEGRDLGLVRGRQGSLEDVEKILSRLEVIGDADPGEVGPGPDGSTAPTRPRPDAGSDGSWIGSIPGGEER